MRNVLIVDDDTIVRITLRSLINWEEMGYHIEADAIHGQQALEYIMNHPVDLVITDMKMPVMDGIGLLGELNRLKTMPAVLVLSGYDDFHLVRDAFRLGACDYLLKAGLTEEILISMLKRLEREVWKEGVEADGEKTPAVKIPDSVLLADMAVGKRPLEDSFFPKEYLVMQFEIEDFHRASLRFGEDFEEELVKPMLQLAGQIPRVASRCTLGAVAPSRYVMLYRITDPDQYRENAVSACTQLCSVWKHFMNLSVSAGISRPGSGAGDFLKCFEEAGEWLRLRCLKGKARICYPWEKGVVSFEGVRQTEKAYKRLIKGLMVGDELVAGAEKKRLLGELYHMDLRDAKEVCLHLICGLAWQLSENHDDISALFAEEVNYYEKIGRLDEMRSLELWLNNYFRWIMDYNAHHSDRKQADMMIRAKRFIMDNYANPELTLGRVADFIGLNEKYFSTRFTKEEGMTFINYLTEVRIRKARELMETTDLKIYEISQSVGYNSVEHFTRVFKKLCGVSPGGYRK
ncbi:helix-turn-helix domain-containing protein [Lachnospiraceae bacterium 54-53]